MIKPTVGRVVWFHPGQYEWSRNLLSGNPTQPMAAIIAYVHSDKMVNLVVIDHNGVTHSRTSVDLYHGDPNEQHPKPNSYCEWMPYQKGQAAKYEELEAQKMRENQADRDPRVDPVR